jgi:hypothetical protein
MRTGHWKGTVSRKMPMEEILISCRFKTQMQHVQHSEVGMENKRKHCKLRNLSLDWYRALIAFVL